MLDQDARHEVHKYLDNSAWIVKHVNGQVAEAVDGIRRLSTMLLKNAGEDAERILRQDRRVKELEAKVDYLISVIIERQEHDQI